jgi:hypothetical protein
MIIKLRNEFGLIPINHFLLGPLLNTPWAWAFSGASSRENLDRSPTNKNPKLITIFLCSIFNFFIILDFY